MEFRQRAELMALLICPNRGLAQQFLATVPETRSFQVVGDLQRYPNVRQLDARLRQLRPDVVLLDLSADTEAAMGLIGGIAAFRPTIYVVGLHESNDASVIIRSLRAGSTEFLCSPFDVDSQSTVITRILRLRESAERVAPNRGRVLAFVGPKAGQGATTLAFQMASIAAQDGKRKVLLADFDTTGGTISFASRLSHSYSVLDAIRHSEKLDSALWNALIKNKDGLDLLLAPDSPEIGGVEEHKVHEVIEYARASYEDVILDLPSAYERISQVSISEADKIFLVCNAELPSLHLTRKLISYLQQMNIGRDRMSLLVNRLNRRHELSPGDMEKVFNFRISAVFPEDYGVAHRALTAGKPIPPAGDLGRALQKFGDSLFTPPASEKKKGLPALRLSALLSQS